MGWKKFSDRLALILVLLIPALWAGNRWLQMPGEIVGATIMSWGLVVQFYFRKKEPVDTSGESK